MILLLAYNYSIFVSLKLLPNCFILLYICQRNEENKNDKNETSL